GRPQIAKLKFAACIATYAWPDDPGGPDNAARIRDAILKCEEHGIDVWVIDHVLSAPGLYGNAWLAPLTVLAYAAALTARLRLATRLPAPPVPHPLRLATAISTLCHRSGERCAS